MSTKDQDQHMPARTLADLRRDAGLTQDEVGERMGVNGRRVGHIEARYPNLRYDTLVAYTRAIGAQIHFVGPNGTDTPASNMGPDPSKAGTRSYLDKHASKKGIARIKAEQSAEELPLQGDQPQPGGDHTGREVDQADPQSDQGDGAQRQQP